MSVKSFFTNIFTKAKEFVFKFYNDNKARIFDSAKQLAVSAGSVVLSYDLKNPEQRAAAVQVVLDEAKASGLGWFKEITTAGEDAAKSALNDGTDNALKKWLHLALLARPLIEKYGVSAIPPEYKFASFAIEWALNEVAEVSAS